MPSVESLTWEKVEFLVSQLALQIESDAKVNGNQYEGIIGIANGGLIPATLLAKKLEIPVRMVVRAKSYNVDNERDKTTQIDWEAMKPSILENKDRKWLIVDDLVDSGDTMLAVSTMFPNAKTAVLIRKPTTKFDPDFFLPWPKDKADEWIVFPWEA